MDKDFAIVRSDIESSLKYYLDRAGMYYRIFSRSKDNMSIKKKLDEKGEEYRREGKKMQDLIGVRVVFYFPDDVRIFHNKLKELDGYDPQNESNSTRELRDLSNVINAMDDEQTNAKKELKKLLPFHDKVFMPERLNVVMSMSEPNAALVRMELEGQHEYDSSLIDMTYEVQLRTVLSEGWHEVEHDLRYKTRKESWWDYCQEESRMLNGLYATLETSEGALSRMIEEVTYKNYQNRSWDAMIRFHFRRRTNGAKLSKSLCDALDNDERMAKEILHVGREEMARWLWEIGPSAPITTDLLFSLINRKVLKNVELMKLESQPVRSVLDKSGIGIG